MPIAEDQMPKRFKDVCEKQVEIYKEGPVVEDRKAIPKSGQIPLDDKRKWLRIPEVISLFVDMKGSTKLCAKSQQRTVASAYRLFTGTAVRLLHEFEAPYIDVQGDGVLALFDGSQPYRALCAAVTFKTFADEEFATLFKARSPSCEVGAHLGIDVGALLVRRIGFRVYKDRKDRQNEVWAGKAVNMSSKLCSMAESNELLVSDRFYKKIPNSLARESCGCGGESKSLWEEVRVGDKDYFDFDHARLLKSNWCHKHGSDYCTRILDLDPSDES